ncbi:MAG TPA: RNA polymerase subunit sigma-24 [Anaerolineaceae bacterium]|uniref:RNA polymerase ECF-type sigma factor n=1 Tax=Anaerolinea thermophila TaxID=167964 RepID=A0A117LH27_9CHLR|nr:MAG: RNA polymerase ECF-type sigma factor [Anaerolinea thermophila]HAF61519.1 RNA polymerase subunit sigma-24 [Anaerolineaceae bacterium]
MPNNEKQEFSMEDVLNKAIEGDLDAFSVLYKENVQRIYNYVYYRTGNKHDAEDLTARVFQRALNNIHRYEDKGVPFSAWLYRIAHNLVANWHRDRSRKKEISIDEATIEFQGFNLPESSMIKDQEINHLMENIRTLPADRQLLLVLKFVDNLTNVEIAAIMDKSEGAIKSLYHRTLLQLRNRMDGKEQQE